MEIDRKETPEEELNRKIRRISCIKSKFKGITQQDIDARIKIYLEKRLLLIHHLNQKRRF
jgi:hypothetical protein